MASKEVEIETLWSIPFGPMKHGGLLSMIVVGGHKLIVVQSREEPRL